MEELAGKQSKILEEIQRIACKMQEKLAEARNAEEIYMRSGQCFDFQYEQFMELTRECSICAEQLTERLRHMILDGDWPAEEKQRYRGQLIQSHRITVSYKDEIVKVMLPILLPHRKGTYSDYIYKPLYLALKDWCQLRLEQGESLPFYEKATICFQHMYDERLPKSRIRDHDNMEEKQVVDALGMFFLQSDGGLFLNTYHVSVISNQDRTVLFLMPQEWFPSWLQKENSGTDISKKAAVVSVENSTG